MDEFIGQLPPQPLQCDTPMSLAEWRALAPGNDRHRFNRTPKVEVDSPSDLGIDLATWESCSSAWKTFQSDLIRLFYPSGKDVQRCYFEHIFRESQMGSGTKCLHLETDATPYPINGKGVTPFNVAVVSLVNKRTGPLNHVDLAEGLRYLYTIAGCQPEREYVQGVVYNSTHVCFMKLVLHTHIELPTLMYSQMPLCIRDTRERTEERETGYQYLWQWTHSSAEELGYKDTDWKLDSGATLTLGGRVGSGSSSVVYRCECTMGDNPPARAVVKRSTRFSGDLNREYDSLTAIAEVPDIHVMRVVDSYTHNGHVYSLVLYPYVEKLNDWSLRLALEYLDALEAFHKANIVVRDVRRENLLVGTVSDGPDSLVHAHLIDLNYSEEFNGVDEVGRYYCGPYRGTHRYASERVLQQLAEAGMEYPIVTVYDADDLCSFVRTVYDMCNPGDPTVQRIRGRCPNMFYNWITDWAEVLEVLGGGVWGEMEAYAVQGSYSGVRECLHKLRRGTSVARWDK
ncbi:hypothetical protein KIPB_002281 [Kipferlia bialata]|uniref:Protein kinase domain-containing protein n=1 Tax=Kipferlia bialata TaxID=797122 RepID=A0A9K3CRI9_9EUKA|nr:hypothetical protein KIPB_002281 [Kipferlia bialata]|eukprot:g2281.t1